MLQRTDRSMAFLWKLKSMIAVSIGPVVNILFKDHLVFKYNTYLLFIIGMKKVFTELHETLSVVKCKKTARFKLFRSATEAERFSIFGQETPVKQIEKNNMSNNLCNNVQSPSYKSLKSDDLVVFRRLIEGGEIEKVKQAVYSNPRFLVSSGDTPLIIQVKSLIIFIYYFFKVF